MSRQCKNATQQKLSYQMPACQRYQAMLVADDTKLSQRKCALLNKEQSEVKCLALNSICWWALGTCEDKKICFRCLRAREGHQRRQCIKSIKCGVDGCEKGIIIRCIPLHIRNCLQLHPKSLKSRQLWISFMRIRRYAVERRTLKC